MTTVCCWLYHVVEIKKMSLAKPKPWKVASSPTCRPNRQLALSMCQILALIRYVVIGTFLFWLSFFSFFCLFDNEISWKCSSLSHHVMFIFGFTASLCGADFPAVWIFGEPPFAPGPGPSQQHLQHFPSPHDCHCRCLITSIFFLEQSQHQPFWTRPVL